MSKRYELRVDADEWEDMRRVARSRGVSVAEMLRGLWRSERERGVDGAYFSPAPRRRCPPTRRRQRL